MEGSAVAPPRLAPVSGVLNQVSFTDDTDVTSLVIKQSTKEIEWPHLRSSLLNHDLRKSGDNERASGVDNDQRKRPTMAFVHDRT